MQGDQGDAPVTSHSLDLHIDAIKRHSPTSALWQSISKYEGKYLQINEDGVKPTARFPVTVFSDLQANHLAVF